TAVEPAERLITVSIRLQQGQRFWLVVSNDHPSGDGASRMVLRGLTSTVVPTDWRVRATAGANRLRAALVRARRRVERRIDVAVSRVQKIRMALDERRARAAERRRERERAAVVLGSLEFQASQAAVRRLEGELAQLSRLRELSHVYTLLQDRRPASL